MRDKILTLISGFRRDVDVICGLLGDYTAPWGNSTREDGTDTLSRNVGKYYLTTPCNHPQDHRLRQHRGGSLKSTSEIYSLSNRLTFWDVEVGRFDSVHPVYKDIPPSYGCKSQDIYLRRKDKYVILNCPKLRYADVEARGEWMATAHRQRRHCHQSDSDN
jgi:hypothetical protein